MRRLIRWILVPLSGVATWHAVLVLGILGVDVLDRLCPPDLVVSGMCTARWHAPAVEALILVCTGIVSLGVVLVPATVAPSHRLRVARLAFGFGATFATYFAISAGAWGPFAVAAVAGSAALWLATSHWRAPGQSPLATC